jgi:eukaryotic-like serine/threonine-protein kinase
MRNTLPDRVRLGVFEVDLRMGELRRDGESGVILQEQMLRVLRMLVERDGGLVEREEIKNRLWPNDTVVEFDRGINGAIKKLRQALGDSADDPRYIETIPRRGYRLLVPVEQLPVASSQLSEPTGTAAARMELQPTALTGRTVSHYRVLDIIGGGGMGVVYRAEDLKLGRAVALKFLPEELGSDPQALSRFSREARAASLLDHSNICPIYQFGEHEGRPFMVMPLLEGQTLRERLAADAGVQKGMPLGELLDIGIQVSEGLQAAHEKGIIHRDIKPANIFITSKGVVKILDFGLAKLLEASEKEETVGKEPDQASRPASGGLDQAGLTLTRTGAAMGTAGYMSPEQVRGEKLDARTDIFSLGLVLYEMATGQRAFTGETAAIVHDAILNNSPVPMCELSASLPSKLEQVVTRALQKEREQRYQSAALMKNDLQGLQHVASSRARVTRRLWIAAVLGLIAILAMPAIRWLDRRRAPVKPVLKEQQLTANPFEDPITAAAISASGKYLAYSDPTGLYLQSTDSGQIRPLPLPEQLRNRILSLHWFPEGDKLIASVLSADGTDLWVIGALDTAETRLLYPHAEDPAISPDGKRIVFVEKHKLNGRLPAGGIFVGDANGGVPEELVPGEEHQSLNGPTWSPDGLWVAYARAREVSVHSWSAAIEVRSAAGGPPNILVADSTFSKLGVLVPSLFTQTWTPDWRLVFSVIAGPDRWSTRARYSLREVRLTPGTVKAISGPEQLTPWSDFAPLNLTISLDGKRLSVLKQRAWMDVYLTKLGSGGLSVSNPRRFTLDNRGSQGCAWTSDSHAILFGADRAGKWQVFRQTVDANFSTSILSDIAEDSCVVISPDGEWLIYSPSESDQFVRRGINGGPQEDLHLDPYDDWVSCSSNSHASSPCVLRRPEGNDFVFYSFEPTKGLGSRLGSLKRRSPDLYMWSISPDASHLATFSFNENDGQIELFTLADQSWHKIAIEPGVGSLRTFAWAADSKGFFVFSWSPPDSYNLLHITLAGKVQSLLKGHGQFLFGPLPSPDGKYLAFGAQSRDSNVWIVENF